MHGMNWKGAAAGVLALALTAPVSAGLVNGGFETPVVSVGDSYKSYYYPGTTDLFGWSLEGGSVDFVNEGYYDPANNVLTPFPAVEGDNWLDLVGVSPGRMSQIVDVAPGTTYALSFYFAAYGEDPQVGWRNSLHKTLTYQLFDGISSNILGSASVKISADDYRNWQMLTLEATAVSSRLGVRFFSDNGGFDYAVGPALDNVALTAVPEPSTVWLLGLGLAGMLLYMCRHRRAPRPAGA